MSKIIDLGVLVKDPLIIKTAKGETFTIPGEISTKFVIKLTKYTQDIQALKDESEAIKKSQELVVDILNLDKTKNVDLAYVEENFDMRMIRAIISGMMEHIAEITKDPNSNSPTAE